MASKRDQLHAYQFLVQRVISALVTRETDPEQPSFRRPSNAAIGGIAIAVISLAGVGVFGMIKPGGNTAWQDGKSVIVEKETGTRYVYLGDRLHPVTNYTSALLAIDSHAATTSVSRNSLVGVPRGPRIGIPDAPDALPGPDRLLGGGWTLCSQPTPDVSGTVVPTSVLMVGQSAQGGVTLRDRAILTDVPETGERYLVQRGYRHLINKPDRPAVGLALQATPAVRVSPAVIEAIPLGRPLAPIAVPKAGTPSTAVANRTDLLAGQLFEVATSRGAQHYLAQIDRLVPITELQFDIQLGYQATAAAYPGSKPAGLPLSLIEASGANQSSVAVARPGDPPTARPDFVEGDDTATVCLTFDPGAAVPRMTMEPTMPAVDPLAATPRRTAGGAPLADRVLVPAGWAAVIESVPNMDAPPGMGTLMVITDMGVAYPLAEPKVLDVLGYKGVRSVRMPANLVARLPMGSGLSHAAAMQR
jgi:type VII secretion protein EccB